MSLKSARLASGLTVREVMEKLNVSDATVYMWENGQTSPKSSRLMEVAKLYGCSVEELLTADPEGGENK